jgi:GrpB-like predicted nucleotidyltransferase (UPF0157 family)
MGGKPYKTGEVMEIVEFFNSEEVFRIAEKAFIEQKKIILKQIPEADIHHVGSTAVPGSLTKGDLDIQVRVSQFSFQDAVQKLSGIYDLNEGSTQADSFRAFKDDSSIPPLGVQLTVVNSELDIFWKMREVLLCNERLRIEYDELKQIYNGKLMEDYRQAKGLFFQKLMESEEYNNLLKECLAIS